jgi:hypothetical protein
VVVEGAPPAETSETFHARAEDTAAPVEGGHLPGEIREMHGLAIPQPGPGPREVGGHIATADRIELDGREVEVRPGLRISRTGAGSVDGLAAPRGATVATIDQGPAGLASGMMNRENYTFGRGKSK